jgi:two-component system phosphate regulon sensor histidine kinase PhoR
VLKWNIRNRLLVSFLLLTMVTLIGFGSYMILYFHRYTIQNLTRHLFIHAQIVASFIGDSMDSPHKKALIDERIKEIPTTPDLRITVIDTNGTVLADSWRDPATMENHRTRPEVAAAFNGHDASSLRFSTTLKQNTLYAAVPVIRNGGKIIGVVRAANTLNQVEVIYRQVQAAIITALLITSLLAALLSFRLARQYTSPLESITAMAKEISQGNLHKRIHLHTGDELEILAHTLNSLAFNLEDKITEITAEKSKLELILQHMDNAVILMDKFGRVTASNRQACTLFGITPEMHTRHNLQVIGNSLLDKAVTQTVSSGQTSTIDLKSGFQGNSRIFQVFLAPISGVDEVPAGVLAVFHDITALQEIQNRQSEFIANASHELATPLTSIKGFAETLLDGALQDKELGIKFVRIIHDEAERMQRMTNSLLQLAKLKSPEYCQQVKLEPIFLKPLLVEAVQELSSKILFKQLNVLVDEAVPETKKVLASRDYMKQVVLNLLDNSIKYTPEGGRIRLDYQESTLGALITIKDSGIGIAPQHLHLIFERFYRTDKARSRKEGGTGLGLSIVKFIIELHGGKIDVQSELGKGTEFRFSVPFLTGEE